MSAFDLHHRFLPDPEPVVQLTFVDSGGYETWAEDDLSAYTLSASATGDWTEAMHGTVLSNWPTELPAVFVSFDRYTPFEAQVNGGLACVEEYPRQLHALLLKPETREAGVIDPFRIVPHASALGRFDIVGVTEKELGKSTLERLQRLALLRRLLDEAHVRAPIHVFGGLDPITVILYFVAGAELFDGLTWLRYGFADGAALYRENYNVLRSPLDSAPVRARALMAANNLLVLQRLRHAMQEYAHTGDPAVFIQHHALVEQVVRQLALGNGR